MTDPIERTLAFLDAKDYGLGSTLLRHVAHGESSQPVIEAIGAYQNADGGIGNGLEVDIGAPASNPWATRLALIALRALREPASGPVIDGIRTWLTMAQWEDGDWRLPESAKGDRLAPWFAAWEHPNLNPSCCLVGLGEDLGVIDPPVRERTESLFRNSASHGAAASADFYTLLPYVEYLNASSMPDRTAWLETVSAAIVRIEAEGGYVDASHFLDHALGGGPDLADRIPRATIDHRLDELRATQRDDGGWSVEYDDAWEPWFSTVNALHLIGQGRT